MIPSPHNKCTSNYYRHNKPRRASRDITRPATRCHSQRRRRREDGEITRPAPEMLYINLRPSRISFLQRAAVSRRDGHHPRRHTVRCTARYSFRRSNGLLRLTRTLFLSAHHRPTLAAREQVKLALIVVSGMLSGARVILLSSASNAQ